MKKIILLFVLVFNVLCFTIQNFSQSNNSLILANVSAEDLPTEQSLCAHSSTKIVRDPITEWETDPDCSDSACKKADWTGKEVCKQCNKDVGTVSGTSYKECSNHPECGGGM
jgi:hypothetical protein